MISLHHDSDSHPIPTGSHIHIRHIKSVWAHWYNVHRYMVAALLSYPHPPWCRFWWSGSLVESKWCHYIMVQTFILFKLLPTSILEIYKVFEHIDMLSIGIWWQPYSVIPTLLGDLGHWWSQNDIITSWLRLPYYSNCFPNSYKTYSKCSRTLIYCP